MDNEKLKLIYINKVGYNLKGEGIYEFVFSEDETNINAEEWGWEEDPAENNAQPPDSDYIDKVINLKTKLFDLICLHEAVDRPYIHGYHNIHALAYESEYVGDDNGYEDYDKLFDDEQNDDLPLLVFHYGMSLKKIEEMFYERKIILKKNNFIEASELTF